MLAVHLMQQKGTNKTKVLKLLYHIQGATVFSTGAGVFSDDIQRWDHGPVIPEVWKNYEVLSEAPLPPLPEYEAKLIEFAVIFFAQNTASQLSRDSHSGLWSTHQDNETLDMSKYPSTELESKFIYDFESYLEENPGKEEIERRQLLDSLRLPIHQKKFWVALKWKEYILISHSIAQDMCCSTYVLSPG